MNEKENLRALSLDSLLLYERSGKKLDEIVHEVLKKRTDLSPSQKAFYVRLTNGCVEHRIRLDHIIGSYSNTPVSRIRPVLLWILRMAVYQISDNDGTPDSAAVNEAVKLAENRGFRPLKGFVNAVLRNYLRNPEKVVWPGKDDPVSYLSVRYSVPEYLASRFYKDYGLDTAEKIVQAYLTEKPLTVHVRITDNSEEETLSLLREEGFTVEKALYPEHACHIHGGQLEESECFKQGRIWVQDISSQMAVTAAVIRENDQVLDVCAAPGGKSLLAADILNGTGRVLSRDITKAKTDKIEENIQRTGLSNIQTEVFDATVFDLASEGKYDVVLADVPCSGYGVIGRKPDIKYGASPEKEEKLAAQGRKILHEASRYVKPGGTLLYSTCTISQKENEENVAWFLENHPYRTDSLEPYLPETLRCETAKKGTLQLLPDEKQDGFFIARFVHEE